ncbi:(2Fe-2S)-binding protein [uncultured Caulobacter sp.]|jgi:isoquinoline 1-oxidoreductase subunit alpha|uniref:(2Fe-2S)-binding protein n=1 Tax=uncultured Caulobacter sp. TaxID=158749 RepID=UPI00260A7224|nr:(2Fe-2S)-binding protein [uncultured Caulobacter sp.]
MSIFHISINGKVRRVDAEPETPMLWVLRDELDLPGARFGCGAGLCGACTIHVDGAPLRACITPLNAIGASKVTTIEGLGDTRLGRILQEAWLAEDVAQCGYCQSGQLMSAASLLAATPAPSDEDIDQAMSGNICRCGAYPRIRKAIHRAANALRGKS